MSCQQRIESGEFERRGRWRKEQIGRAPALETGGKSLCGAGRGARDGGRAILSRKIERDHPGEGAFGFGRDAIDAARDQAKRERVGERAKGFDQIVGQREGVAAVGMMNAERGVEADRKSVGEGKSVSVRVDLGGRRDIKLK